MTWQNLNGIGVTADRDAAPDRAVHVDRDGADGPGSLLGRHAGQRHDAEVDGVATWSDVAGGDGGQVLVDPTDANFVYGTYFGISPYRFTNAGNFFFSNQSDHAGHQPERPLHVLHPDDAEQA